MMLPQIKKYCLEIETFLTGKYRVVWLLLFAGACHLIHFLRCPFPTVDSLGYLHILHDWNCFGSIVQVLEKYPKFGLLLFSFLPLKWGGMIGIPLYPASVVLMILMSMVSVYALYKIVLLLSGDVVKALWCGVLLCVHPMILFYAGNLLRDTPYLMYSLLLVLCTICAVRERKWYYFLLTGMMLAMCVLSRFESWELLVIFPVYALFYMGKKGFEKRSIWAFVLLAAAGFFGTLILLLATIDDLSILYAKGRIMFLSFFPQWMRW